MPLTRPTVAGIHSVSLAEDGEWYEIILQYQCMHITALVFKGN